jgi:pimeloyl-ACP methyl ester carboxylesterase
VWHLTFNRIAGLNEELVAGREDVFFRWEFDAAAKALPDEVIDHYVAHFASSREALSSSFGFYRALDATIAQDTERKERRLTMPVLAIGGELSFGAHVGEALQAVADDVEAIVLAGVGHFVAEEAPAEVLAALSTFLAPYRDGVGSEPVAVGANG